MPTTRPRHFITESDELAQALDAAARRWPDLSRGQLVTRLALEAHRLGVASDEDETQRRRRILGNAGAVLAGSDAQTELNRMRAQDWPE